MVAPPAIPRSPRTQRITLGVILFGAIVLAAWVASPLWIGILLGAVIAFTVQPIYERVLVTLHGKRALSAALVTIGSGAVLAAIGAAIVYLLSREVVSLVAFVRDRLESGSMSDVVGAGPARLLQRLGIDRTSILQRAAEQAEAAARYSAGIATVLLARTTNALLELFIALLTTYYVLLQWALVVGHLERLVPLDPAYTRSLMTELRRVGRTAFVGTVATAVVQGGFATVGYLIGGVPQPIAWGVLTAIASFLPVVGTAIIYVPIGVVMIATGHVLGGVVVLAWGILVVMALSDYVIRPRIVGEKGQTHPLLMLIALLGGVEVMGIAGLIVGPIAMSFLLAVIRLYERANGGPAGPSTELPPLAAE